MRTTLYFTIVTFICFSCGKEGDINTNNEEIEFYTEDVFLRYNHEISCQKMLLNKDESVTIVGNGMKENKIGAVPVLLKIGLKNEITWSSYFDLNRPNLYLQNDIIFTHDQNYMLLSASYANSNTQIVMDLTNIAPEGNLIWNMQLDESFKNDKGALIRQLPNNDIVLLSVTSDDNFTFTNGQLRLTRISFNGIVIWSKILQNSRVYGALDMVIDLDDNTIVILNQNHGTSNRIREPQIHKIDFNGNVIWETIITTSGRLWPLSGDVLKMNNGDLIVSLSSAKLANNSDHDLLLIHMDNSGNEIFRNSYGGNGTEVAVKSIQTIDNNYIHLISTSSYRNNEFNLMLLKINEEGEELWRIIYGSESSDQAVDIIEKSNGDLIVLGNTNYKNPNDGTFDFFILRTDLNGKPK